MDLKLENLSSASTIYELKNLGKIRLAESKFPDLSYRTNETLYEKVF